jgi:hypothetical protein
MLIAISRFLGTVQKIQTESSIPPINKGYCNQRKKSSKHCKEQFTIYMAMIYHRLFIWAVIIYSFVEFFVPVFRCNLFLFKGSKKGFSSFSPGKSVVT